MTVAIITGSFDPITNGHLNIITRGSKIFDKVIVAVAVNGDKKSLLPIDIRKQLIINCVKNLTNIEVEAFEGLMVDFLKKHNAKIILRGLRNSKDFEYESEMENINKMLDNNIETVYLTADSDFSYVSSSAVREILRNNGDISRFVPEPVEKYFRENFYN